MVYAMYICENKRETIRYMEVFKMSNSELLKAFNRAYSLGNTIPQGQDRRVLEKLTRQFKQIRSAIQKKNWKK